MFGRSGSFFLPALLLLGTLLVGCPQGERDFGAKPEARFEASPRSGSVPLYVEFFDDSDPGASAIAQWHWEFGDNTTSSERNPRHTYYVAGDYTVSLRVTTALGTSTKIVPNCVTVVDPITVAALGIGGGTLEAFDGFVTAPAGALADTIIMGMTAGEGQMPLDFSEQEQLVSAVYSIQHDRDQLLVEPGKALEIDLPYYALMVPETQRTDEKLFLFARLPNGARIPIPGRVSGERFIADVAGLPRKADYAVVHRPTAISQTLTASSPWKATTSYNWQTHAWRLSYAPGMMQALTALRLGNPAAMAWYDWREFPSGAVEDTRELVFEQLAEIHQAADDAGLISPVLYPTAANEYKLLFYSMLPPNDDYAHVGETMYANSLFGSMVIDPEQLVAISKRQARAASDGVQELEFPHAFAAELFRAIFRGYDYPLITEPITPQYGTDRRPVDTPFTLGFAEGFAVYLSQVAAGETTYRPDGGNFIEVLKPRTFTQNEQAMLSEPLFAPASPRTAAYATATQDFFFYVTNKHAPNDPLTYIADSYDGVLEMLRIRCGAVGVADYQAAMHEARLAVDASLWRVFDLELPDVYLEYARARAYENPNDSKIRPSDYYVKPFTFNDSRFEPQAVVRSTINSMSAQAFTPSGYPRLANVPPLSTVAVVLTAAGVKCNLKISTNAYQWLPDTLGNTMCARVYIGSDGAEVTRLDSEVTMPNFGVTPATSKLVILLTNTSMEDSYSVEVTATPQAL